MTEVTWLSEEQLAQRLGFSRDTVKRWRNEGVGPPFMKVKRSIRYNVEAVKQWEREAQS